MSLTAEDLWPLIQKLPVDERKRLADHLRDFDQDAYQRQPLGTDEFTADEDPLAWEADGWEEYAPR